MSPSPTHVTATVKGRAAVTPSLLWNEIGGEGDFAPLWLFDHLRLLGYVPLPAGFWWQSDIPIERSQRLADFAIHLDEAFQDDDRTGRRVSQKLL